MGRLRSKSVSIGRLIFLVVLVCLFSRSGYGAPWAGSGTEGNPYQIWTAADMQAIGADPNYWGAYFKLCADIDLGAYTGTSFNIIGIFAGFGDPNNTPFTGIFDGDGHTISNFMCDRSRIFGNGLFGYIDDSDAEVKNLGLIDPNINAGYELYAGPLVGYIRYGTISGCYVEGGGVSGVCSAVGGLVGYNEYGDIQGCYSTAEVKGNDHVGGLVGATHWDIQGCYSTGSVTGAINVGGLVGRNQGGYITSCYSMGSVTGDLDVGGLVGENTGGNITDCYSTGGVTGVIDVGGLVGASTGYIQVCYSTGSVSGDGTVGGLVGGSSGNIQNCYSTGSVSGDESRIGGLVGYNRGGIKVSYSKGGVLGAGSVGGLVGYNDDGGNIEYCYSTGGAAGVSDIGGLVGYNYENIQECYSTGGVTGEINVGGLVGSNNDGGVDIEDCYSTGNVVGDSNVGGLVGGNTLGEIEDCYSSGSVAGDSNVGGLIGSDSYGDYYTPSFWDSEVNPLLGGIGNGSDLNVIGLPTAEMQTESTYTDAGWDFVAIWKMNCEGMSYPKLSWWEPALGDFICPDGVNFVDFAILGDAWFSDPNMGNWDPACDISEPNDGVIDGLDLGVFVENWLEGI